MAYHIKVRIDRLPPIANASRPMRPRVRAAYRRQWGDLLGYGVFHRRKPPKPLERARVVFTRHSSRKVDYTNLVGSFKLIEDILQPMHPTRNPNGLGIIAGDDPDRIEPSHFWEFAPRREGHITIEITEIEVDHAREDHQDRRDRGRARDRT